MAIFVNDTFTDTAGTTLALHTADSSATWIKHGTAGINAASQIASGGTVRPSTASATSIHYTSATSANVNYDAVCMLSVKSLRANDFAGVVVRLSTSANTNVFGGYAHGQGWIIVKNVAGTSTTLATVSATAVDGDTVMLRAYGSEFRLYVNGTLIAAARDMTAAINTAGRAGTFLYAATAPGDAVGVHLTSFVATDGIPTAKFICFDGDSMTASAYVALGRNTAAGNSFPGQTLALLDSGWDGVNYGVDGQTLTQMSSDAVAQIDGNYDSVRGGLGNDYILYTGGTNDLNTSGTSTATVQSRIQSYGQARKAGTPARKVLVSTIQYGVLSGTGNPFTNANAATVNAWTRTNFTAFADMLIDVAEDYRLQVGTDTGYRSAEDGYHLNVAGYGVKAALTANAILGCTATSTAGGVAGAAGGSVTVACRFVAQFGGTQSFTITSSNASDIITPSVGAPGTGSVTLTPPANTSSFNYSITRPAAGFSTLTYSNNHGHTNPAASTYTATSADDESSSNSSSSSYSSESSSSSSEQFSESSSSSSNGLSSSSGSSSPSSVDYSSSSSTSSDSSGSSASSSSSSSNDEQMPTMGAVDVHNTYPGVSIAGVNLGPISRIDQMQYKYTMVRNVEGPVTVTLTSPYHASEIRYTLNGRMPTDKSPLYSGPLTFRQNVSGTDNTVIKARIYGKDRKNLRGKVVRLEFRVI